MIINPTAVICAAVAMAFVSSGTWAQTTMSQNVASQAEKNFMKTAIETDLSEIQMGKLAQQDGMDRKIKQFGRTIEDDHRSDLEKARILAQQIGMVQPTKPNAEQQSMYDKLDKLSGKSFDDDFAKDMVRGHNQAVSEFRAQAKKQGPIASYAEQSLPALQKHLRIAESLQTNEH